MQHLKFSTADLPRSLSPGQKASRWADMIASQGAHFADTPNPDRFFAKLELLNGPDFIVGWAASSSIRLTRMRDHIAADGKHSVMFLFSDGGGALGGRQAGRETTLRRGEALVVPSALPNQTYAMNGGQALFVILPAHQLGSCSADVERIAGRVLPRNNPAQTLAASYARLLLAKPEATSNDLSTAASRHLAELFALALKGACDHNEAGRGVDDVRAQLLLDAVEQRCMETDLDPARLGQPLGLSGRSVQHILQARGTTFSAELRDARLRRAEHMLRQSPNRSVFDIALDCGFLELSTFYRAFRSRYGMRPGELRAAERKTSKR